MSTPVFWSKSATRVAPYLVSCLIPLAVAGCGETRYSRPLSFGLEPIEAAWKAGFSGKVGLIEVYGLPATAPEASFVQDISSPVGAGQAAGFTLDPKQSSDPRYRVVLIFNAPATTDGNKSCTARALGNGEALRSAGETEVQATLCADQERVSEIRFRPSAEEALGDGNRETDRKILRRLMQMLYRPPLENESDAGCQGLGRC